MAATAIVAGGQLILLHGLNAVSGGGQLETLPISGVAAGWFFFDRHGLPQLAAYPIPLRSDGTKIGLLHPANWPPRPLTRIVFPRYAPSSAP